MQQDCHCFMTGAHTDVTTALTHRDMFIVTEDLRRQHFLSVVGGRVEGHELAHLVLARVGDVDARVLDRLRLQHVQDVRLTSLDLRVQRANDRTSANQKSAHVKLLS